MTVGERIKQRRMELGYSQSELAALMGYSGKTSVCKAETYGDNITTTKIEKYAKALGVTSQWLLGWEDNSPSPRMLNANVAIEDMKLISDFSRLKDSEKKIVRDLIANFLSNR